MPPKKTQTKPVEAEPSQKTSTPSDNNGGKVDGDDKANGPSKKRKAEQPSDSNKTPRRSARGAPPSAADPVKLLEYLLSPSSLDLCRPKDEIEDIKNRGTNMRTYSVSTFTPFEELVCALILSRPIGHMLGLRSIRTIFNSPYDLTTPQKIRETGSEGCRRVLDQARTQHRQKTAEELVILADAVVDHLGDGEDDVNLERVRKDSGQDTTKERGLLKKNVKGVGKTGLDIFARRIQGIWSEFYPFIDERTSASLTKLGLPGSAAELKTLVEDNVEKLKLENIEAKDGDEKKRKAFVRILERAVGGDLEGNIDSIKAEIA